MSLRRVEKRSRALQKEHDQANISKITPQFG